MDAAYRAAEIATKRRADYIAEGTSFVTETVFSHPSKLELLLVARQAGFRVVMFHLGLASADLAVARVAARVTEGGHPVPEEKIRARFQRNLPLIRKAATIADRANVYDASRLNVPPKLLLRLESGMVEYQATLIPEWCQTLYGDVIHRSD